MFPLSFSPAKLTYSFIIISLSKSVSRIYCTHLLTPFQFILPRHFISVSSSCVSHFFILVYSFTTLCGMFYDRRVNSEIPTRWIELFIEDKNTLISISQYKAALCFLYTVCGSSLYVYIDIFSLCVCSPSDRTQTVSLPIPLSDMNIFSRFASTYINSPVSILTSYCLLRKSLHANLCTAEVSITVAISITISVFQYFGHSGSI